MEPKSSTTSTGPSRGTLPTDSVLELVGLGQLLVIDLSRDRGRKMMIEQGWKETFVAGELGSRP